MNLLCSTSGGQRQRRTPVCQTGWAYSAMTTAASPPSSSQTTTSLVHAPDAEHNKFNTQHSKSCAGFLWFKLRDIVTFMEYVSDFGISTYLVKSVLRRPRPRHRPPPPKQQPHGYTHLMRSIVNSIRSIVNPVLVFFGLNRRNSSSVILSLSWKMLAILAFRLT